MAQTWESTDIQKYGQLYSEAKLRGDIKAMENARTEAEKLRNAQGYQTASNGTNQTALPGYQADSTNTKFTPIQQQPQTTSQDYIEGLRQAQIAANVASLDKAKASALSSLDAERAKIEPAAYANRNAANVTMNNTNRSWDDFLAAKGLNSSGIAGQGFMTTQNQYQGQIGAINRDASNQQADINRRVTDVNNTYAADLAAAHAGAQATALQNLISQYNADRTFNYQAGRDNVADQRYNQQWNYNVGRDKIGDQRYEEEQAWSRNANNPAVQAQILSNKIATLELQNLPEQQKLEIKQIKQRLAAGEIDLQIAKKQLDNYGRSSGGGSKSGSSNSSKSSTKQFSEDKKAIESEFYALTNPTDREKWLNRYQADIVAAIGIDGLEKLRKDIGKGSVWNYSVPASLGG